MSPAARRDELLYESAAALRLVDRAIQELRVGEPEERSDADEMSGAMVDPTGIVAVEDVIE